MADRPDPDAVHAATVDTGHAARLLRKARAFHTARGRVSAADRNLSQALHPASGVLTDEQRSRLILARDLIRSVTPDLHTLADLNPAPAGHVAPPAEYAVPAGTYLPKAPVGGNVIRLAARRRAL